MKQSSKGKKCLQTWEGCKTRAYRDGGGVWTIGYGHTGPDVTAKTVWTQAQCDAAYAIDILPRERAVNKYVKVPLTQNQFDALVSFVYNVGEKQFKTSTLVALLNDGRYESVPTQLRRWNKDNGVVVPGLVNRRELEIELFLET